MLRGFEMSMSKITKENYGLVIGIAALLIHVIVYTMTGINLRILLIFSFITIPFGIYIILLMKLRSRKDEREIQNHFKLKTTVVIPKNLTPLCTVEPFVKIVKKVFKDACASIATDVEPCEDSSIVEKRYEDVFKNIKKDYKKERHIYVTETAFFIVLHRIETSDVLWIRTVLDTIESVQKETYNYQTGLRENGFRVVSVTSLHDMRE